MRRRGILPDLAINASEVDPLVKPAANPVIARVGNEVWESANVFVVSRFQPIALEEPTGASCSRPAAVTVFRRTVPTKAPAAENARHGEKRDGDSRDFGQKPVRC